MDIQQADFVAGATDIDSIPEIGLPEIAFAGRSNVGKSSLINSIVRRRNLAHTSSTPGKTQQINFYMVEGSWSFADLPGFGYASVSKSKREKWVKLTYDYLSNRKTLEMTCALIDSRHDPMDSDLAFLEWLELNAKPFLVILTKTDKISAKMKVERKEQVEHLVSQCSFCYEVLPYSAVNGTGRSELIGILKKAAAGNIIR